MNLLEILFILGMLNSHFGLNENADYSENWRRNDENIEVLMPVWKQVSEIAVA